MPQRVPTPRSFLLALLAAGLVLPAMKCKPGPARITEVIVVQPADGLLSDDASQEVFVRMPGLVVPDTIEMRLEGVDLLAAFGVSAPFTGAFSGVVSISGSPVTVTDLVYSIAPGEQHLGATLSGLPPGTWMLEADGERSSDQVILADSSDFSVVGAFSQQTSILSAGGVSGLTMSVNGPQGAAAQGDPFAAPPVANPGGSELRSGFVEAGEALIR